MTPFFWRTVGGLADSPVACTLLAQTSTPNPQAATQSALMWAGILGGMVVIAGVVLLVVKMQLNRQAKGDPGGASIFEELRQMRARGEISDQEFEQAKKAAADRLRGQASVRVRPRSIAEGDARIVVHAPDGDELRAREGYDLTGRPLPGFSVADPTTPKSGPEQPR